MVSTAFDCVRIPALLAFGLGLTLTMVSCTRLGNSEEQQPPVEAPRELGGGFEPAAGAPGGTIVLPALSDPKTFNPVTCESRTGRRICELMYEGLVRVDPVSGEPRPHLAESWEVSFDSLVWTFHLRTAVLWSDSAPLTAQDVVFTFEKVFRDSALAPAGLRRLFTIGDSMITVSAVDTYGVRFELAAQYAALPALLTVPILPEHRYAPWVRNRTFDAMLASGTRADSMAGTGPFILASHVPYQRVVLRRNPHYWKRDTAGNALPYLDSVVFSIADDLNARRLRLQNQQVDYLTARPRDYEELAAKQSESEFTIHQLGPALGSAFIVFNQNRGADSVSGNAYVDSSQLGWFTSTNFRRALSYALDRQRMIDKVYAGHGYAQWSPLSPANIRFHNPDVRAYAYDPDKARALLLAQGFDDGNGDGVLEDSTGNPVKFSLLVNDGNLGRLEIGQIICENFEALGLEVALEVVSQAELLERFTSPPYAWQAALSGMNAAIDPALLGDLWRSSGPLHLWNPAQDNPATQWEKSIDSLFNAALLTGSYDKRRTLYSDWQYLASEHLPMIFTVLPERMLCLSNRFRNSNPTIYGGILHNIEELYVADSDSLAS